MALSRSALATQQVLIARLIAAGATKGAIAEHAGVDACVVSKWITDGADPRAMTLDEARRLADVYGWDLVMGPLARPSGWTIARAEAEPCEARMGTLDLSGLVARLAKMVHEAAADGRYDPHEREQIAAEIRGVLRLVEAIEQRIASGRVV
jgi:hypothetical protein